MKIRKVEGYQNYDKSEFESASTLGNFDDDKLEKIWKTEHSLMSLVTPSEFKSYDDLKNRLDRVLGVIGTSKPKTTVETIKESAPKARPLDEQETWADTATLSSDEEFDYNDYFSKLADED